MTSFLNAIWGNQGDGIGEIRILGDRATQIFLRYPFGDTEDQALRDTMNNFRNQDIFFGVILRDKNKGTKDACKPYTPVIWADLDQKDFGGDRLKTFRALQGLPFTPQIVVDSGHGFHAYWLLDRSIPTYDAQMIMSEMSRQYGTDVVGDPARVMRLPGTINHKTILIPVDVRVLRFDPEQRTRASDMLDIVVADQQVFRTIPAGAMLANGEFHNALLLQEPPVGTRSEVIFGVVCHMIRSGFDKEQAFITLLKTPVGEKLREQHRPEVWFDRTWAAAYKEVLR